MELKSAVGALDSYDVPNFLAVANNSTAWHIGAGVEEFIKLLEDQERLMAAEKPKTVAQLANVVDSSLLQVHHLTKLSSHLFRALSTVLDALGALPPSVDSRPNVGSFGEMKTNMLAAVSDAVQELKPILQARATVEQLTMVNEKVEKLQEDSEKASGTLESLEISVTAETSFREDMEQQFSASVKERMRECFLCC